ncbi:hypothetical protein HYFRA_00012056 [Hymenoscyphus fraxineus]|uniref:Uncharacterized protein n=1 Tax=Hymenoscyphus fraxineus TaxID=746836 RepID=A0A9N9PUZ7_9HELO|nr:hypothetical protein HYFRA_00012056 [Hymenoscyphus fraxineus]
MNDSDEEPGVVFQRKYGQKQDAMVQRAPLAGGLEASGSWVGMQVALAGAVHYIQAGRVLRIARDDGAHWAAIPSAESASKQNCGGVAHGLHLRVREGEGEGRVSSGGINIVCYGME